MKLYAFKPNGHGEFSFFVMAENEQKAREAVDRYGEKTKLYQGEDWEEGTRLNRDKHEMQGWGSDYYSVEKYDPGEVAVNNND